ncbi:MAG: site-specific tyrosine recombinase/integron integrase [bacterium]
MEKEITLYLDYLKFEKKLSNNTYLSYKNDITVFSILIKKKIDQITKEDIQNFIYNLDKSPKTKAHYLTVLNSFFSFLYNESIIRENPVSSIKNPKIPKKLPNYLSVTEIDSLLDMNPKTHYDYRNKAMLEVLYATGIRISELLNIETKHIDYNQGVIKIMGKGSKERFVPINDYALKYLKIWINDHRIEVLKKKLSSYAFINHHGNEMTRQGFFKIVKQRAIEARIRKEISPHTLRHSFATHLLNNGADIRIIQELLGHENLVTTEIYTHLESKKMKNDYNLHPHAKK